MNDEEEDDLEMNEEPNQDQINNDNEIEEIEEKDEGEGRASLEKYTTGQQKAAEPGEEKEESQKGNSIVDSVSNYLKSSAVGSPGMRATKDTYYCGLQEFIDNTLKMIATKIAEKKGIELETSGLKISLSKLKEDIRKEEQMQRVIKKNVEQEVEVTRKREKDNQDLAELLQVLKDKTEARQNDINAKLSETEEYYQQVKEGVEEERQKFEAIKTQLEEDRVAAKAEIKNLELAHAEATGITEDLKKRIDHAKILEYERVKMLRQKSKLLATLIGQETITGKSSLHKDISKILRSPTKQGSVMQAMSKSYTKA